MSLDRLLKITSPLGEGVLVPTQFLGSELLGLPYAFDIEAQSPDDGILPEQLLTQGVTLTVTQLVGGETIERHFHGLVAEFSRLGSGLQGYTKYQLVLVPGIWRLSLRQNCRVFQEQTVQDIVNAVLAEHGQPTPQWGILPELQALPYCTQFNETDLHFVSRLLEEHGLTYYFTHTASAHLLHISSTAPGFPSYAVSPVKAFQQTAEHQHLGGWRRSNRARTAKVLLNDMDGERSQPSVVLNSTSPTRSYDGEPTMWAAGEHFGWPGGMATRPGVNSAGVEMGARETASEEYTASFVDARFIAGARLQLSVVDEAGGEAALPCVVTSTRHQASDWSRLPAGAGATQAYAGTLSVVASSRTWMPAPRHARPVLAGLYSAKVTGPSGEQIHVDEFGRIKLRFRWDRTGPQDDGSSCWVRVAQAAAGAWGGTWFLPRVGDEVLVAFLDGDPDRPIVTGSVYGKDAKPPFEPGTNRSQSGIRTRSYKSSSSEDANVLRFEDKKDSEEVLLHAQKDLTVEVENDETRTVKNARTTTIEEADDTLTVKAGNRTTSIDQGNDSVTVASGDMTLKCSAGSITLEAMQKITLKVGQNTIVIDQQGITTNGMLISSKAEAMHKTEAPMVKVDGSASVMVTGGIVMIN